MVMAKFKSLKVLQIFITTVYLIFPIYDSLADKLPVSESELTEAIIERQSRVFEFSTIAELAKKVMPGLEKRIYMLGGAASTWAHYVHWDLLREKKKHPYLDSIFDYQFDSIFRSSQDFDLAVDGTPEEITALQQLIDNHLPYKTLDGKNKFELRPLYEASETKNQILSKNEGEMVDFHKQNTDSASTGLITLVGDGRTAAAPAVKDIMSSIRGVGKNGQFLQDVLEQKIHYYHDSRLHKDTPLAKAGSNPQIISAIRYLIKVCQFGLTPVEEDLKTIHKIINRTNPKKISPQARDWIVRNAVKLYTQSTNFSLSQKLINRFELKKVLTQIIANQKPMGTDDGSKLLQWYLDKEVLEDKGSLSNRKLPCPSGKKAKDLLPPLTRVAHVTDTYDSYMSITHSIDNHPNAFISRADSNTGELAVHGDGFYTCEGSYGSGNSHFNIQMTVDPDACLGIDFDMTAGTRPPVNSNTGDCYIIVWKNRSVLNLNPPPSKQASIKNFLDILKEPGMDAVAAKMLNSECHNLNKLQKQDPEYQDLPKLFHTLSDLEQKINRPKSESDRTQALTQLSQVKSLFTCLPVQEQTQYLKKLFEVPRENTSLFYSLVMRWLARGPSESDAKAVLELAEVRRQLKNNPGFWQNIFYQFDVLKNFQERADLRQALMKFADKDFLRKYCSDRRVFENFHQLSVEYRKNLFELISEWGINSDSNCLKSSSLLELVKANNSKCESPRDSQYISIDPFESQISNILEKVEGSNPPQRSIPPIPSSPPRRGLPIIPLGPPSKGLPPIPAGGGS